MFVSFLKDVKNNYKITVEKNCYSIPELLNSPSILSLSDSSGEENSTSLADKIQPPLTRLESNIPTNLRKKKQLFTPLSPSIKRIKKSGVFRIFKLKSKVDLPTSTPINTLNRLSSTNSQASSISPILKDGSSLQESPFNSYFDFPSTKAKQLRKSKLRRSKSLENFRGKGRISNLRTIVHNLHRKSNIEISSSKRPKSNEVFENVTNWRSATQDKLLKIDENTSTDLEFVNRKLSSNVNDLAGVESFESNLKKRKCLKNKVFREIETQTSNSLHAKQDQDLSQMCPKDPIELKNEENICHISSPMDSNNKVIKLEKVSPVLSDTIITISSSDNSTRSEGYEETIEENEFPVIENKTTVVTVHARSHSSETELPVLENKNTIIVTEQTKPHSSELESACSQSTLKNLDEDKINLTDEPEQFQSQTDNPNSISTANNNNFVASKELTKSEELKESENKRSKRSPILTRLRSHSNYKQDSIQICNVSSTSQMKPNKTKNKGSKGKNCSVELLESNDIINVPSTSTQNNKRDSEELESSSEKSSAKKFKTAKNNLENIVESNRELDSSDDSTIVYVKRKPKKIIQTVQLHFLPNERKSGFFRIVDNQNTTEEEEITANGRPRRNRKPPPRFIQASYLSAQDTNVRVVKIKSNKATCKEDKNNYKDNYKKRNNKNVESSETSQESVNVVPAKLQSNSTTTTDCKSSMKDSIRTRLKKLKSRNKSIVSPEKVQQINNVNQENIVHQTSSSCNFTSVEEPFKNSKRRGKTVKQSCEKNVISVIENISPLKESVSNNAVFKNPITRCIEPEHSYNTLVVSDMENVSALRDPNIEFESLKKSTLRSNATNDTLFEKPNSSSTPNPVCGRGKFNKIKKAKTDLNSIQQTPVCNTARSRYKTRGVTKQINDTCNTCASSSGLNLNYGSTVSLNVNNLTNENIEVGLIERVFEKPLFDKKDARDISTIFIVENLKYHSMFISNGYLRLRSNVSLVGQPTKSIINYRVDEGEGLLDTLNKKQKIIAGESFFIPIDVKYTLQNTSKKRRLILFFNKVSPSPS